MKEIKGNFTGKGRKFGIVISLFNELVSKNLLDGCRDTLLRHSVEDEDISTVWVSGSFEIPLAAKKLALSKKYDAVICLGAVIRGDTPHFDYVSSEVMKGLSQVNLTSDVPVISGIITADSQEQAFERAGVKQGNKGRDAALAALEMADVFSKLNEK